MASIDLAAVSAVLNALAALGVLWVMQSVTAEAGVSGRLALIKLAHRAALAGLAFTLFWNAAMTVETGTAPRMADLAVQAAMFLAVIFSAIRHAMVAPLYRNGIHHQQ